MLSLTFGTPNATGTIVGDMALSTSEISPAGFPAYVPVTGQTVQSYFYVETSTGNTLTFPQTPQVQLQVPATSTWGMATGCEFFGYIGNGSGTSAWQQVAPATASATISGASVTIAPVTLAAGNTVSINPIQFFGAVVCQ